MIVCSFTASNFLCLQMPCCSSSEARGLVMKKQRGSIDKEDEQSTNKVSGIMGVVNVNSSNTAIVIMNNCLCKFSR